MKEVDKSSTIKDTNIDKIVEFDNDGLCGEIDELCPVLSASLKGSLGAIIGADKSKAVRVGIYGSIFKQRYLIANQVLLLVLINQRLSV